MKRRCRCPYHNFQSAAANGNRSGQKPRWCRRGNCDDSILEDDLCRLHAQKDLLLADGEVVPENDFLDASRKKASSVPAACLGKVLSLRGAEFSGRISLLDTSGLSRGPSGRSRI